MPLQAPAAIEVKEQDNMDVNELRMGVTLLSFVAFLGIVVWAWSQRRAAAFDEAAQLPFVAEAAVADAGADRSAP